MSKAKAKPERLTFPQWIREEEAARKKLATEIEFKRVKGGRIVKKGRIGERRVTFKSLWILNAEVIVSWIGEKSECVEVKFAVTASAKVSPLGVSRQEKLQAAKIEEPSRFPRRNKQGAKAAAKDISNYLNGRKI